MGALNDLANRRTTLGTLKQVEDHFFREWATKNDFALWGNLWGQKWSTSGHPKNPKV